METITACRVGVVDDDESLCRAMLRLLKAEGFTASAWHSAEAFLADSNQPPFDCLLLDVQMDGMSGIDLLRVLQNAGTAPPVVFVTALAAPEYREQAERAGCVAYLRKNDPGSVVIAAIRQAAGGRGARITDAPQTFPQGQLQLDTRRTV